MKIDREINAKKNTEALQIKNYNVSISENLSSKLEKHLNNIKISKYKKYTKAQWISEAIYEKIDESPEAHLNKEQRIHLKLPKGILDEIDKRIQILKKAHVSYSKKKWIMESIYDKLDREGNFYEQKAKKVLLDDL